MPSIVIAGGGVMGASAAYHLARAGWRDIVVVDRAPRFGLGSTARATGGFRAQFATAINIRLSLLAREKLRRFEEEIGIDPGYIAAGYLWLAASEGTLAQLREAQILQHECGLREACELSLDDAGRLNAALRLEGLTGAVFCPTDGFIRPLQILAGYIEAASRLGVTFRWGVEVIGAHRRDGRLKSVATSDGAMDADVFVNAAGAWAGGLARVLGADAPVVPLRRQVAATVPTDVLPASMPMTIFADDGFHLRVRDGRVLLLEPSAAHPEDPFDTCVDDAFCAHVVSRAHETVPVLREVPIDRAACWAGLYEMSPDKHAILGPHHACPNLFLMNGSSGHGVMHAPALGQLLAELISGRATALDVRPLRPGRFAEGEPNPVSGTL